MKLNYETYETVLSVGKLYQFHLAKMDEQLMVFTYLVIIRTICHRPVCGATQSSLCFSFTTPCTENCQFWHQSVI